MKVYFCPECACPTALTGEPDEGETCSECDTDLFENDPIIGEFSDEDARKLKLIGST